VLYLWLVWGRVEYDTVTPLSPSSSGVLGETEVRLGERRVTLRETGVRSGESRVFYRGSGRYRQPYF